VLAGCGSSGSASPATLSNAEHRYTAELPAGWELAAESLTPSLTNPVEILVASTVADVRPAEGRCAQLPVGGLERLGPRDALVTVQERYGEPTFGARPERFELVGRVDYGGGPTCADGEEALEEYWFGFDDANRGFHVLVAFGPDAPAERREEALALLDSLRFEPGPVGVRIDPDLATGIEDRDARLGWQLPTPRWQRYDWPLTSAHTERVVAGTFDLEPSPPDANCTPRAALDAMPPGGALVYAFEYLGAHGPIAERRGELELGPPIAFECMGESRMVRWRERGRVFQAHVYLGPRAGPRLERDAQSILNSIQVR
jgi:hypothetical protein